MASMPVVSRGMLLASPEPNIVRGTAMANDILTNCRLYPKDEAPAAYKDFDAVLDSVKSAGLASEVARLKARFVIKDADTSLKGAA